MTDRRIFRIWSGVFFLIFTPANIFSVSWPALTVMGSGCILRILFLNLVPGAASLILAEPKKRNSIVLTAVLAVCLLVNLGTVTAGFFRNISFLYSDLPNRACLVILPLLDICVPLAVSLALAVRSLKTPGETNPAGENCERRRMKTAAGIVRIIAGALMMLAGAAGAVVLLGFSTASRTDPEYLYIYLAAVFSVVLILSGVISLQAGRGNRACYVPEIYSFMIIVVCYVNGPLKLLLSWMASGGYFLEGSGDVVIVRGAMTFLLVCMFLWHLGRMIVLSAEYIQERRRHAG